MTSHKSVWLVLSGAICVLLFVVPFAFGRTGGREFRVRQEDSNVGFSVYKWLVVKEEGRFRDFSGTVFYNPEDRTATKVDFTIQTASVDSRPGENNIMMVEGDITIPVKVLGVHFANQSVGHIAGFESTFMLNRFDFNVGPSSTTMIGSEVTIHLLIGANGPATTARQ